MGNISYLTRKYPDYPQELYTYAVPEDIADLAQVTQVKAKEWLRSRRFTMFQANWRSSVIPREEIIRAGKEIREQAEDIPSHLKELGTKEGYPCLPTFIEWVKGKRFMRVWCLYCRRWHFHGADDGVRTAHCLNVHICYTSYFLQEVGEWGEEVMLSAPPRKFPGIR